MAGNSVRMPERPRSRGLIFAAVLGATLVGAAAYVTWAALRGDAGAREDDPGTVAAVRKDAHVVFQDVRGHTDDDTYSRVALSGVEGGRERVMTSLQCERVYFAAGRGLCLKTLTPSRFGDLVVGRSRYEATITGPNFGPRHDVRLSGLPSRARISPDGRLGATTVFVTGHSYAEDNFSTQTVLLDMRSGRVLSDLEKDFSVTRGGKRIKEIDFNFWGVTFANRPGLFYATLGTGGKTYLLEGNVRRRVARVLRESVECPSISPDNTRLAYKQREGKEWRLHVLDLSTMSDIALAERRSIDDQVEWLDDDNILYGFSRDTWVVPADGTGTPRKFISRGLSPAVVRG